MARVAVRRTGCWEWLGAQSKEGYGVLTVGGKQRPARRVFWEGFVGEIPAGEVVAQRLQPPQCVGRLCCNPAHLLLRSNSAPTGWPVCSNGHQLLPSNVIVETVKSGSVERCRKCRLEYWKTRRARPALE
jgi:hypothetical protein